MFGTVFMLSAQEHDHLQKKHFVIVIASRNNTLWCDKNLESIVSQNYDNWRAIYINDASTDDTGEKVEQFIKDRNLQDKIMLINNETRQGALANIFNAVWMCNDWDCIILLDGDDWLSGPDTLTKLNDVYANENIWMTYGSYEEYPSKIKGEFAREIPTAVIENNSYRSYSWCASHLRSFYVWLFKSIKKEDLMTEGSFFPMAWDLALMFPMLEMSGQHSRYIPDILYTYNLQTEFNDHKIDTPLVVKLDAIIRTRSPYQPLKEIPAHYLPQS